MPHDLRALTERYVAAFHARDLDAVAALLAEEFELTDPEVTRLTPRANALDYIGGLFEATGESLSFVAERILVDGDHSAIEFELRLGDDVLKGVDMITWHGDRMVSMRAHLTKIG